MNPTRENLNSTASPAQRLSALAAASVDGVGLASPAPWLALFVLYLLLCCALRFRREAAMRRAFNYPDRASMASMTNDDAQAIMKYIVDLEFPYLYNLSMQFGLFKTYGIETISKLLVATKALTHPDHAPKRYEDTVVIYGQFTLNKPTSQSTIKAISRMNSLHAPYIASGQISNADLLYTLSVGVTEPIRFMRLYEWRALNDMELCATGTFWKSIGDAMQIRYEGYLKRTEWRDGIEWAEDITEWAKKYEMERMRPAKTNVDTANRLLDMLFWHVPRAMMPFATEVLTALMGERVRDTFEFPEPGIFAIWLAYTALNVRRFLLRYCFLPRFFPVSYFSEPDPKTGRIYHWDYLVDPWYHKPTFLSRWGPLAIVTWLLGGKVPGAEGDKLMPQGFLFEELGPVSSRGKGLDVMKRHEERLKKERSSGCPFAL